MRRNKVKNDDVERTSMASGRQYISRHTREDQRPTIKVLKAAGVGGLSQCSECNITLCIISIRIMDVNELVNKGFKE